MKTPTIVPPELNAVFERTRKSVQEFFAQRQDSLDEGRIEIAGERFILFRGAALATEFFDIVRRMYADKGELEAQVVAWNLLFDMAHAVGVADARHFHQAMGLTDPVEKMSAGPMCFAQLGWSTVQILPESHVWGGQDFFLVYDHQASFESEAWKKNGRIAQIPVCAMNAGYSSGWCEESYGLTLVSTEILCRARGDAQCRFIMAQPERIEEFRGLYMTHHPNQMRRIAQHDIPAFFSRKRAEDDLRRSEETLRRQNAYHEALHEVVLGVMGHLSLTGLLETILDRAGQMFGTLNGLVYLCEPDGARMSKKVARGPVAEALVSHLVVGKGFVGGIASSGQPVLIPDYDSWAGRLPEIPQGRLGAMMGVPLISQGQVVGVLGLVHEPRSGRVFEQAQLHALERFGQLAAIALENARLYLAAQEARRAAEARSEEKSAFLANVNHEMRTPLTSILGFARIIQKQLEESIFSRLPAGDPSLQATMNMIRGDFAIILAEGERLTGLINDVLDLTKIEAGKMEWRIHPLSLEAVINHAAALAATGARQKGLALTLDIEAGLPLVNGDRDRLVQIVLNLFSNAVKFTDRGSVTCRASLADKEIRVSITDTGIGIAAGDHAKIFQKFSQVGDTLTGKPKGTGLGLTISKQIVEHHGGRIGFDSRPGEGSTFYFTIPVATTAASPDPEPDFSCGA